MDAASCEPYSNNLVQDRKSPENLTDWRGEASLRFLAVDATGNGAAARLEVEATMPNPSDASVASPNTLEQQRINYGLNT